MRKMTLPDSLKWSALTYPHKVALICEGEKTTYSELNANVNGVSNAILEMGFEKGDKICILLFNCNEYIEILYGLTKIGVIPVPLNFRFIGKEIEYIMNHSDSKGLIVGEEFLEVVTAILSNLRIPPGRVIVVGKKIPNGMMGYEDMLTQSVDHEPNIEVEPTDIFWIQYTGGTTGFPKGCIHLHEIIMEFAKLTVFEHGVTREGFNLTAGPIFHTAPTNFAFTQLMMAGTVYIMKHFIPAEALKIIDRERITNAFMVPSMFDAFVNLPDDEKKGHDVSSMQVLISGGAPLHTTTKDGLLKLFKTARLYEFYAGTETGLITSISLRDHLGKIRCVGQPAWGQEVKILDDSGNEVRKGDTGSIYMTGVIMFSEYYKNPKATEESFRGKWVTLGDMGRLDEEGYLYIVDRKKDMVVSGGENIYPIEIEAVILMHSKVREVAVIGVPDERWGEALKAIVILKKGEEATEEEMINFCSGHLAGFKKPKSVEFREELPKSANGKVLKRVLREPYWKGRDAKV